MTKKKKEGIANSFKVMLGSILNKVCAMSSEMPMISKAISVISIMIKKNGLGKM